MSATLMQVLDTTIVNVALPHMQGALNAAPDQISWTLTSYLISSAIFMPLTGYFSDMLGRKKYLLLCIGGFTIASAFCGAAQSLSEIVLFRLLQGIFGAALVPLSQAIMVDIYELKERGKAMAIWGVGVMAGPVLGPTLGGYLTDILSWRWTFYVNVPIGIIALILAWQVVPDTIKKKRSMDWNSLALISLAIGSLQYFLDRGNQDDWFNAHNIQLAALLCIAGFIGFILRSLNHNMRKSNKSVFDLHVFKDRNFTIASLLLAIIGLGLYGTMVIQPLFLESLLNYPALSAGWVMAPMGIGSMLSMMLVGKIINYIKPRNIIIVGIIFTAIGTYFCTYYSQNIDFWWLIWPTFLRGFGLGMTFVPLAVLAFSTLPNHLKAEATGVYSLIRTLGSSIGIAITLTIFTRHTQIAWNQLGGFINPYNPNLINYLSAIHLKLTTPIAHAILGKVLNEQAQTLSFVNVYAFITWSFLFMLPLAFLIKDQGGNSLVDNTHN